MGWAAVLGYLTTSFVKRPAAPEVSPDVVRAGLAALAALQLFGAGWQARTAVEHQALAVLREGPSPEAVAQLRQVAWWRPEIGVAQAHEAEALGDAERAIAAAQRVVQRHPHDADALRHAALVLLRQGAVEDALVVADAATVHSPNDWRSWAVRAEALERLQPEVAGEAWLDAMRRGAPTRLVAKGWRYLPVGLPWVQAVQNQSAARSAQLAAALVRLGDEDAALVAYTQAYLRSPAVVYPAHARLLVAKNQPREAESLLREALRDTRSRCAI